MEWNSLFLLLSLSWVFFIKGSCQLQSSQAQVLLQLKKHLEYPKPLEIWYNKTIDFCYLSSPQVNITCQDNFVTEIRVLGDKPRNKVTLTTIDGFSSFPNNQTLSESFSMDSFVATLSRLTSLRVLVMVSLGMWGPLPDKIHRLYALEHLDLSSNFLFGSIPPQISRLVQLQNLALDGNFLNGTLPDISSLTSLQVLDLSDNKLDSGLPLMPKSLVTVILGSNSFSREIPRQYGQLVHLQHLDLSSNSLEGTPLPALFALPNISYLNLASNMLSGSLPVHLNCGNKLEFVDISNNKIRGLLPSCLSSAKFDWNCLSIDSGHEQNPESYCDGAQIRKGKSKGKDVAILVGVVGGLSVVVVLLAIGCVVVCRKYCPRETSEQHLLHNAVKDNNNSLKGGFTSDVLANARYISQAAKLVTEGFPMCRVFSFEELMEATNKFNKSSLMGEGSFGKLYKGRLENGNQVAIRCLTVSKKYTVRNLKLRLDLLGRLRHPYLVCLLGHCIDSGGRVDASPDQVYLVYEYVPNGTYSAHLSDNSQGKGLKWSDRLGALIGVAKAVHFLHTGIIPGFFNNRLKASNILLNEHRVAKLSDYGLSIIAEETNNDEVDGDDLKSRQMKSLEDDVYSFGLILLDSLLGHSASTGRDQILLNEMESFGSQDTRRQIVDPLVLASCSQESLSVIISLTNKCISPDSSIRPSFEDVLWNLQYASQVQAAADGADNQ